MDGTGRLEEYHEVFPQGADVVRGVYKEEGASWESRGSTRDTY